MSVPDFDYQDIESVALVEASARISQKRLTERLLTYCSKGVELDYNQVVLRN